MKKNFYSKVTKAMFLMVLLVSSLSLFSQINYIIINEVITGDTFQTKDLNADGIDDFTFDVNEEYPDVFVTSIKTIGASQFLDSSSFGYPLALDYGDSVDGVFSSGTGILGTFTGAGLFTGAGVKYIGLKIVDANSQDFFCWMSVSCSATNDTLFLYACAYESVADAPITAGQTSSSSGFYNTILSNNLKLFPVPTNDMLNIEGLLSGFQYEYRIYNLTGQMLQKGSLSNTLDISTLSAGTYHIEISSEDVLLNKLRFIKM